MPFRRLTGSVDKISVAKVSGTAVAEGDLVKKNGTSNNVTAATAGAAVLGIACSAGASSSTANIDVDVLHPGDSIEGDVSSGTPASGDFKSCDIASATGIAYGTDSSHDFLSKYNGSTTSATLWPKKLEVATAA
jgi:hypothetical protein